MPRPVAAGAQILNDTIISEDAGVSSPTQSMHAMPPAEMTIQNQ